LVESSDRVVIKVELPREEYLKLVRLAEEEGYAFASDYVRALVARALEGGLGGECPEGGLDERRLAEAIARRLERRLADLINPFTAKIDEMQRRIGELVEALEAAEARGGHQQAVEERPQARRRYESRGGPSRGMERLRAEGVVFESDLRGRLRQPEAFLRKLEGEGAIVLDLAGERVAVDPGFWDRLVDYVSRLSIRDEEEVESLLSSELGERAARLFRLLVRSGAAYYDEDTASWVVRRRRYRGPASS